MLKEEIKDLNFGVCVASDIINKFNNINNYLNEANDNSAVLLENTLFSNEDDLVLFLKQINYDFGDVAIDEFQLAYANKVISVLKEKIPFSEVQINIDISIEGYFFLVLSTVVDGRVFPLMCLNFYLKEIYMIDNQEIISIKNQMKEVRDEIDRLEEHLCNLEKSDKNPLYLAGDNSIKMMDMLIRKKKYAEEIKYQINDTINLIKDNEYKLSMYRRVLEDLEMNNIKVSLIADKYIDRLSKYYKYTVIEQSNDIQLDTKETEHEENLEKIEFDFETNK